MFHATRRYTVFFVAKLFVLLTQPLAWITTLLIVSLLVPHKPALGRKLVVSALGLLLLMGWLPLPERLIRHLETHYAEVPPQVDLSGYAGMVVLGGSTEPGYVAQDHAQPLFNNAGERLTAPVALMLQHPHLRMLYTGGEGDWLGSGPSESQRAAVFFSQMGVPAQRIEYESASRTTYENAVLTAQLPGVDASQRWLLVTSAWHMPRAMATFAKAGWNVTAYPVDFRTGMSTPWTAYSLKDGTRDWQLVLHELLGVLAYRVTGRL